VGVLGIGVDVKGYSVDVMGVSVDVTSITGFWAQGRHLIGIVWV